jgi:hypothetical protein
MGTGSYAGWRRPGRGRHRAAPTLADGVGLGASASLACPGERERRGAARVRAMSSGGGRTRAYGLS